MSGKAQVPKFGNWEGDSVPYTVYFENARKGKANGRRMNPNDPEDNPEMFKALAGTLESQNKPVSGTKGDGSTSDQLNNRHHAKSLHKKGSKESYSSFSSSISSGHPKPETDQMPKHYRAASIPKFGAWDEADPTSGEGFTVIFNKVKQEKHVRTINLPTQPQPPSKAEIRRNKSKCYSFLRSKISCCFFH